MCDCVRVSAVCDPVCAFSMRRGSSAIPAEITAGLCWVSRRPAQSEVILRWWHFGLALQVWKQRAAFAQVWAEMGSCETTWTHAYGLSFTDIHMHIVYCLCVCVGSAHCDLHMFLNIYMPTASIPENVHLSTSSVALLSQRQRVNKNTHCRHPQFWCRGLNWDHSSIAISLLVPCRA